MFDTGNKARTQFFLYRNKIKTMNFESKFNIGDKVFYWSDCKRKVSVGEITGIGMSLMANMGLTWKYYIKPATSENIIDEYVSEYLIFKDKDEVLDFAVKLTEIVNK